MRKVLILKGLPGSGKSSYARKLIDESKEAWVRVNKDDLRAMCHNSHFSRANEKLILSIQDSIILEALKGNKNVIVDNTHLNPKVVNRIRDLVKDKAEVIINDSFLEVPVEECIKRDLKRVNSVGKDVIMSMYMKYLRPEPTLKRNDPDLPTCIIVDLDGTLALNTQKRSYYEPKPKEILNDELNKPIAKIVSALHKERLDLFFFSGRSNRYYEVTVEWLSSHNFIKEGSYDTGMTYKDLLMRKEGDSRSDATVKEEMYRNNIEDKYNVLCVIDDRPKVIRKWKDLGIFVLDVNQSGLDF